MTRRGAYVWLVGPDGSGKSTLASSLDPDHSTLVYWRASVMPMARELAGRRVVPGMNASPHERQPDPGWRAVARLLYYALDNLLGHYLRVRPATRRGRDFVVDRGWADMVVDPRRYGFRTGKLARLLFRVLPKPDAIVLVRVTPETAHQRKPELPVAEIQRQYEAWTTWRSVQRYLRVLDNDNDLPMATARLRDILNDLRSR